MRSCSPIKRRGRCSGRRPLPLTRARAGSCAISEITGAVSSYYSDRLRQYGATPAGVDWSSRESQRLRFIQLLKLINLDSAPSLIDYGCGYGALAQYLIEEHLDFTYVGFDLAESMVEAARSLIDDERCRFTAREADLQPADYVLASGIFNVKLQTDDEAWHEYVVNVLDSLASLGSKGFAFNMLSRHADPHLMRGDLYYADPGRYLRLCTERYSRRVVLLHDYELYEFTVLVRLGTAPKPLAA